MTRASPVDRLEVLAQRRAALVERAAAERRQVGVAVVDLAPAARWLVRGVGLAQWLRAHPGPLVALMPLRRFAVRWMRVRRDRSGH